MEGFPSPFVARASKHSHDTVHLIDRLFLARFLAYRQDPLGGWLGHHLRYKGRDESGKGSLMLSIRPRKKQGIIWNRERPSLPFLYSCLARTLFLGESFKFHIQVSLGQSKLRIGPSTLEVPSILQHSPIKTFVSDELILTVL